MLSETVTEYLQRSHTFTPLSLWFFFRLIFRGSEGSSESFCNGTASDREENSMTHKPLVFYMKQASGQRLEEMFLFFKQHICKECPLHMF